MSHHYEPVTFSHAELAHELHLEHVFLQSNPGEIIPDEFWTRVVASYDSNHEEFLRLHACPLLDRIMKHDKLECITSPSVPHTDPGTPTSPVCPTEPMCTPHAVPEPSGFALATIVIAVFVFFYAANKFLNQE